VKNVGLLKVIYNLRSLDTPLECQTIVQPMTNPSQFDGKLLAHPIDNREIFSLQQAARQY
jgi:hypothetical protein